MQTTTAEKTETLKSENSANFFILQAETRLPEETLCEMFNYLFDLQESGETNMWGASSYLEQEFDLEKKLSSKVTVFWMQNYEEIKKATKS
jgi:hypothetical protein